MALAAGRAAFHPPTASPARQLLQPLPRTPTNAFAEAQVGLLRPNPLPPFSDALQRLPRNLHYLITLRRMSAVGALYLLITWAFPLAGLAYFVAPKVTADRAW